MLNHSMKHKKVLVFSFLGMGDFIWATSAISLIKQYDSDIKLTLITFDSFAKLADKKLNIDKFILINNKAFNFKLKFFRILYKLYWFIKNFYKLFSYDTVIFLDKSKLLTLAAKYFYRIKTISGPDLMSYGYNNKNPDLKYYNHIVNMPADSDRTHMMMRYQMIMRSVFPTYNMAIPVLKNNQNISHKIQNILLNSKKYKIALCMSGQAKNRYWPSEYFKITITKLNELLKNNVTFFIVGKGQNQYNKAETLINQISNTDIKNICNKTSLTELQEFFKYINLLISVDTGVIHLAAAENIPAIAIYGQSLPERSAPISSKALCLCSYIKCSPCYDKINCSDIKCMKNITPDMVVNEAKDIFKS